MNKLSSIALAICLAIPSAGFAQKNLEQVADEVIASPHLITSIYKERRDEGTGLVKHNFVLEFTERDLANKVIEAFKKDRPDAINYDVVDVRKGAGELVYRITFKNNGVTSIYTLIKDRNKWIFTKNNSDSDRKKDTRSKKR